MKLPIKLQEKIVDFLISLPNIYDSESQRAFVYRIGLDQQLQDQILFGKPPAQFVPLLVSTCLDYGKLDDGRHAIIAVLESTKRYVGQDKKICADILIKELRKCQPKHVQSEITSSPNETLYPLFFSKDSTKIYSDSTKLSSPYEKSHEGVIKAWDVQTGKLIETFHVDGWEGWKIRSFVLSPDGHQILCFFIDETIGVFDLETKTICQRFHVGQLPSSFAYAPDGRHIVISYGDGKETVKIWDISSQKEVQKLEKANYWHGIDKVLFSPDGRFVSAIGDWRIGVWDTHDNYKLVNEFSTVTQSLNTEMLFSPDNNLIWIQSAGGNTEASCYTFISVYDLLSKEIHRWDFFDRFANAIRSIDISPDGKTLLAGGSFDHDSPDEAIYIWDRESDYDYYLSSSDSFINIAKRPKRQYDIYYVRYSPDGEKIACGAYDRRTAFSPDIITIWS